MNFNQKVWFLICAFLFLINSSLLYRIRHSPQAHYDRDSYGYVAIAEYFAQTSQLKNPYSDEMPVQTVGYPFFVGILYKLFGIKPEIIIFAQIILSILAGLLIMKTTLLLFGNIAGYISALLWALNLGFLIFSQFFMTEIVLVTLLLVCIYNFLLYMKNDTKINLIISAFFCGLSVAVKPIALLYSIGLCFCLFIFKQERFQTKIKATALFYTIFLVPVLGYMTFNKIMYNTFSVSSLVHENIYVYFLSKLTVHAEGISYTSAMHNILATSKGYSRTNPQRWQQAKQKFWNYVYNHPLLVVKIWLGNVGKTFFGLFSTQLKLFTEPTLQGGDCSFSNTKGSLLVRIKNYIFGNSHSKIIQLIALTEALWNGIRYLLIALAILFLCVTRAYFISYFFIGSIVYLSIITGHDGCGRYRMMFEPFLIILTSYAFCLIYNYRLQLKDQKNLFLKKLLKNFALHTMLC